VSSVELICLWTLWKLNLGLLSQGQVLRPSWTWFTKAPLTFNKFINLVYPQKKATVQDWFLELLTFFWQLDYLEWRTKCLKIVVKFSTWSNHERLCKCNSTMIGLCFCENEFISSFTMTVVSHTKWPLSFTHNIGTSISTYTSPMELPRRLGTFKGTSIPRECDYNFFV